MIKKLALLAVSACLAMSAQAQINVFTQHQVISMLSHGVNQGQDVRFKTGDYPYIGQIGVEYQRGKFGYTLSYIHRSNVDITDGDEYNYNGIALGISYRHCLARCR